MEKIIYYLLVLLRLGLVIYLVFSRWHWIKMYRIISRENDCLRLTMKELDSKNISFLNDKRIAEQKMRLMELRMEAYKLPDGTFGTNDDLLKPIIDEIKNMDAPLINAKFNAANESIDDRVSD